MRQTGLHVGRSLLRAACAASLLALLVAPASAAKAPSRRSTTGARAVATYVFGSVKVLGRQGTARKVGVGDELPQGARLRLGPAAQLTVLWASGVSTTVRGPREVVVLAPPRPARRRTTAATPSVAKNVWQAARTWLRRLGRGPRAHAVTTEAPLAVRAPQDRWQMQPGDEQVQPGPITLTWRDPAGGSGPYLVLVRDAGSAVVWQGTARVQTATLPISAGLVSGQHYRWVVSSEADSGASPTRWFEILAPARANGLEDELRCAQDLFRSVTPASQLHAARGCIYQSFGLLSEARAEYQAAAALSPVYRALADAADRFRAADPGSREQTPCPADRDLGPER